MNNNTYTFSTIIVSGVDSKKFLQGQITANLDDLEHNPFLFSAYCNQQGRVISVFAIFKKDNDLVLLFLGDTAATFLKKIKKYSVFSKINFATIDYNNTEKYLKIITNLDAVADTNTYIKYFINNKIPIITEQTTEKFLPDSLNLIDLSAVSFKKGCFLGQEIIARVYYKGTTKKKLYKVNISSSCATTPSPEAEFNLDGSDTVCGSLICAINDSDYLGLAVLEERFINQPISLDKAVVQVLG